MKLTIPLLFQRPRFSIGELAGKISSAGLPLSARVAVSIQKIL
jgi:hypothetical protein